MYSINVRNELVRLNADSEEMRKSSESNLISMCKTAEERFLMKAQFAKMHQNLMERQLIERQLFTFYKDLNDDFSIENELLKMYTNVDDRKMLEEELIEVCEEIKKRHEKESRLLMLCKNPDVKDDDRLQEMKKLIQEGVDLSTIDDDKRTPLLLLCERGRGAWLYECVKLVLTNNLKPQQVCQGIHNCWSFHCLTKNEMAENVLEVFKLLITNGINVNCKVYRSENVLLYLCKFYFGPNLLELVQLLIDHEIIINSHDADGKNALMAICERHDSKTNHISQVMRLLIENNINLNSTDEWGQNALFYLLDYYENADRYEMVKYLIDRGIDVNCRDRLHGLTPLSLVCLRQSCYQDDFVEIVKLLIESGSDVNSVDEYEEHVFIKLCTNYKKENLHEIIHFFIKYGVELNCRSIYGSNALVKLCENYSKENLFHIVQLLIANGIDVKCTNRNGHDVIAALFRNPNTINNLHEIVLLLLGSGANFRNFREADRQRIISSFISNFKRKNVLHIFNLRIIGFLSHFI